MSKSKARQVYERWQKSFNSRFAGKTVPANQIDWEISKLCRKLDERI